jgi:hypothetical protein
MTRSNRLALGYIAKTLAGAAIIFSLNMPPRAYGSSCNIVQESPDSLRNAKIRPFLGREPKSDVMRRPDKSQLSCKVKGGNIEYYAPEGTDVFPITMLEGEKIIDSACTQDRAFVITNKRLRAITNVDPAKEGGRPRRVGRMEITPLPGEAWIERDFGKKGVAAWTHSYGACYVLTHDRELTVAFFDDGGSRETVVYRNLPFPADTAKMVYYSGFLFIAAQDENLIAFSFRGDAANRHLPIAGDSKAGFAVRDGRLFYGKDGKEVEIKVNGPGLESLDFARNY